MTKVLKLSLLGQLQLAYGEAPLAGLASGKAQALLCYLALDGRPHSRQALAGLLWGELPEADARRNLRGTLLKLRHVVEPHILVSHQSLAFNGDSDYWLDVEVFRRCLDPRAGGAPAQLRQAVALYRGDFLEDFYVRQAPAFEEWVARQRAQLQELAIQAYHELARYDSQQGDYAAALAGVRRLLEIDPAREEAHRQLMQLLALSGQRSRALAQYEFCRDVLAAELGVEPAPETVELVERIRSGEISRGAEVQGNRGAGEQVTSHPFTPSPAHPSNRRLPTRSASDDPPPFIAGPPITHPARFFGREYELKRLFNLFRRRPLQNAAIVGPRRSGKTSLLHYLKSITTADPARLRPGQQIDWLPQPEEVRWIFVDFQDPRLGGSEGLLRHLLANMALPAPEPWPTPGSGGLEYFLEVVGDNLHTPTVVLFDEIGVALQRYPELDDAFWESLRSLATNQVGGNLGFVLSAAEPPEALARYSGLGSPFFNIFGYTAALGPLSEAAARELLATSPIPFPEADVDWMLQTSGRWPILLQILGRERLLALEDGETGHGWREDALRQMAPFKRALLEDEGVGNRQLLG